MKSGIGFVACAYLMLVAGPSARADTLDEIRRRGSIRWGGDQEGGGPYIFPKPDNPRDNNSNATPTTRTNSQVAKSTGMVRRSKTSAAASRSPKEIEATA